MAILSFLPLEVIFHEFFETATVSEGQRVVNSQRVIGYPWSGGAVKIYEELASSVHV